MNRKFFCVKYNVNFFSTLSPYIFWYLVFSPLLPFFFSFLVFFFYSFSCTHLISLNILLPFFFFFTSFSLRPFFYPSHFPSSSPNHCPFYAPVYAPAPAPAPAPTPAPAPAPDLSLKVGSSCSCEEAEDNEPVSVGHQPLQVCPPDGVCNSKVRNHQHRYCHHHHHSSSKSSSESSSLSSESLESPKLSPNLQIFS